MAGKSKRDKKVVVNQAYFELIERKAQALDQMYAVHEDGNLSVSATDLKTIEKIVVDWEKVDAGDLSGSEPYTEPK